ncbi:MAG TPA: hypothetical protein VKA26_08415 [Ignavibacteriaceae bacterium]|nr:hypothetical protein [Ignavibacteriaceae bacterium]
MESYSLKLKHLYKYNTIYSTILFIIAFTFIAISNSEKQTNWFSIGLLAAAVVLSIYSFIKYLHKPVEIKVSGDEATFIDLFKKENVVKLNDIINIELKRRKELIIRTNEIVIVGFNGFADFARFIDDIKKYNGNLELQGF